MIVSFRHRFVFVAIPKTATHAIRAALRPHLGRYDWEQCLLTERKAFPIAALSALEHGHLTCEQVRPFLFDDFWESCLRFCVVRNPYERFASYSRFVHRESERMRDDPRGVMKAILADARAMARVLLRPQHEFVTSDEGRLLVSHVCRFERLQPEFDGVCDRLGLPAVVLPRLNVSGVVPGSALYDSELRELVHAAYERDFTTFGYSPDDMPA